MTMRLVDNADHGAGAPGSDHLLAGQFKGSSLHVQLETFRRTHSYRELHVGSFRWRYLVSGQGERALLLPSGGTRVPDMYFLLFNALEPEFRIVAPAYPPAPTMGDLVTGVTAILDAEEIRQADVFGSSFGGFVAQCFVRQHPEQVRSLVLANTGVPGCSPLPGLGVLTRLLAQMPEGLVRWATGRNWRHWFRAPPEQQAFWWGLLDELVSKVLTKRDLVCALEEMRDYMQSYQFTPRDLATWPGRVLIIESAHDEAFSPAARAAIRSVYPQAKVHTFDGAGHAVMVVQPTEYVQSIRTFLSKS